MGMQDRKWSIEKIEELQKGNFNNKRFVRE